MEASFSQVTARHLQVHLFPLCEGGGVHCLSRPSPVVASLCHLRGSSSTDAETLPGVYSDPFSLSLHLPSRFLGALVSGALHLGLSVAPRLLQPPDPRGPRAWSFHPLGEFVSPTSLPRADPSPPVLAWGCPRPAPLPLSRLRSTPASFLVPLPGSVKQRSVVPRSRTDHRRHVGFLPHGLSRIPCWAGGGAGKPAAWS